jgi:hypothetical protein
MENKMESLARLFVFLGITLLVVGGVILLAGRVGVPFIGQLPGDFTFRRDGVAIYIPLATSILLSIVLTVVLTVVSRLMR